MSRLILILLLLACVGVVLYGAMALHRVGGEADRADLRVLIAHHEGLDDADPGVLAGWRSVMQEEGLPFECIDLVTLRDLDPARTAATCPALVLPDAVCRRLNSSLGPWLEDYLDAGGALAVVYDAGIQSLKGAFLPRSELARYTGVQPVDYTDLGSDSFTVGGLRFASREAAARCRIPPGKLDDAFWLTGYGYGRLSYPMARTRLVAAEDPEVLAWSVDADGKQFPAIVTSRHGPGRCLHVNLPLGHLKANGDDLPLRALMRWWLEGELGLPHLMNVPDGIGGVVFNWHVDGNGDWPYLDDMIARGVFRPDLRFSVHICAGPDLNEVGDRRGFDACGTGRRYVEELAKNDEIGSHGGWAHNLFAQQLKEGRLSSDRVRALVSRNADCLRGIVGRPIVEYSAPDGVYPPDLMTPILEDLGFTCNYSTGDVGSAPNRTFYEGRMLSAKVISFPVMPLGAVASFGEMDTNLRLDAATVADWLRATTDYCERERTVRLLYSHPYNLYLYHGDVDYLPGFLAWEDDLAARCRDGRLQVRPMSEFATFLNRMLKTRAVWRRGADGLRLELENDEGLRGIAVSVSADRWSAPAADGLRATTADGRIRAVITTDAHATTLTFDAR